MVKICKVMSHISAGVQCSQGLMSTQHYGLFYEFLSGNLLPLYHHSGPLINFVSWSFSFFNVPTGQSHPFVVFSYYVPFKLIGNHV